MKENTSLLLWFVGVFCPLLLMYVSLLGGYKNSIIITLAMIILPSLALIYGLWRLRFNSRSWLPVLLMSIGAGFLTILLVIIATG
jgi:hypothetical protein